MGGGVVQLSIVYCVRPDFAGYVQQLSRRAENIWCKNDRMRNQFEGRVEEVLFKFDGSQGSSNAKASEHSGGRSPLTVVHE